LDNASAMAQLSDVVGVPRIGSALAHEPASAGVVTAAGAVIEGNSVSLIVNDWEAVAVRPEVSVAVHVIVYGPPTGYDAATLLMTVETPQLSVAVAVPMAGLALAHEPASDDNTTAPGAVIDGAWRSMIETVWFATAEGR